MAKLKFTGAVLGAVIVTYIIMTILMPVFSTLATAGADEVAESPNAESYIGAQEALNYFPLWIYFVPAVIGIGAIVIRLKQTD